MHLLFSPRLEQFYLCLRDDIVNKMNEHAIGIIEDLKLKYEYEQQIL